MLNGLEHVGKAIDLLTLSEGTLGDRLLLAMCEFRLSLANPDEWPIDLFPLAEELDQEFSKNQDALDRQRARKIAEHLMMLADSVTVLLSEEAHRQLDEILGPDRQ